MLPAHFASNSTGNLLFLIQNAIELIRAAFI